MKTLNKIIFGGFTLLALAGCVKEENQFNFIRDSSEQKRIETPYFAGVSMYWQSGMAINSGDFDNDGDLDLIVGANDGSDRNQGKLYFYENDGKGNFTLRPKVEYE